MSNMLNMSNCEVKVTLNNEKNIIGEVINLNESESFDLITKDKKVFIIPKRSVLFVEILKNKDIEELNKVLEEKGGGESK